ncbi:MBL fold metallo-hydrolase [Paenibacillus sp. BC26]|uniref:MBL fold metallo-hydrolase n=1 Tax=Paenibacillus sp. BC26 TaxID=1881032 RepID=UPI001C43456D|nr:MBL fold metallo-hydrolase [Paenibacillus sp. BC26]
MSIQQITENIFCYKDTCNVYIIRNGDKATLIDFGSGDVLNHLKSIGVSVVTDVLMTHHHRDQGQGLSRAAQAGIRIWVPHTEQEMFQNVDERWQAREVYNNYNVRQDRFSLLESVPVWKTLTDYAVHVFNGIKLTVIPTPGHTLGAVSFLVHENDWHIAFTGDLIYAPGKVWSMSATQWTYHGDEGVVAGYLSLLDLKDRAPDLLLPSHGSPMDSPESAIDQLLERFDRLLKFRKSNRDFLELREQPYEIITPHLLMNKTSVSNSFVLLSDSGKALLIDYGYDFRVGCCAAGYDRSARRPWLYNIEKLKKQFGVTRIDVVLPTHFHDDHVAGFNLLRDVEGTSVWAADNFADILEDPARYDLPCIWFDRIPVDRVVPLGKPFTWEEYEFTLYEQAGHALNAVAISFEADGKRVVAIGDQQANSGDIWNYIYKNRFRASDYTASGNLYLQLQPELIISGHWPPVWVEPSYLELLRDNGEVLEQLHNELLPVETIDLGADGSCARIYPYQQTVKAGEKIALEVEVVNPLAHMASVQLKLVFPSAWQMELHAADVELQPKETFKAMFTVNLSDVSRQYRARIGVDVTVDDVQLGQHAEALITIV